MSLDKLIDEQIKNAIAEGLFDNLKGAGKPLNLDDYFAAPEDLRAGYTLLKNNDFVPAEIELLKEIRILREKIKNCGDKSFEYIFDKTSFDLYDWLKNLKNDETLNIER